MGKVSHRLCDVSHEPEDSIYSWLYTHNQGIDMENQGSECERTSHVPSNVHFEPSRSHSQDKNTCRVSLRYEHEHGYLAFVYMWICVGREDKRTQAVDQLNVLNPCDILFGKGRRL